MGDWEGLRLLEESEAFELLQKDVVDDATAETAMLSLERCESSRSRRLRSRVSLCLQKHLLSSRALLVKAADLECANADKEKRKANCTRVFFSSEQNEQGFAGVFSRGG